MKSLFGRNINILRGSKASVLSKSTFSAGVLSLLSADLPNSFSTSVCVLPPQFVNDLLIINPLFETREVIVIVTLLVNQCIYKYLF